MAVTQTGSVYTGSCSYPDTGFNISSIIIPADAEAAIIIFSNESSLSEYVPNKISWDNDTAVDFTEVVVCKGNDYPASSVAAYIMPSASGNWPGSGSGKTLYVDFSGDVSGSGGYYIGTVFFVKGLDTSDPIRNTDSSGAADNVTNQTITSNISGVVAGDLSVLFTYHWPDGSTLVTTPDGYSQTEIVSTNIGSNNELAAASRAGSGVVRMTGVDYPIWAAFALKGASAPAVSIEQEGFRFRNDDGSESAATWKAAQDTNITLAADTPFRLRKLLNATGDPDSIGAQLEYRYKPSGGAFGDWKKVN